MSTIAVTGASGAVGSRVLIELSNLASNGSIDRVVAIDRRAADDLADLPGISFNRIDLTTTDIAETIARCDTIVHLAEERSSRPGKAGDDEAQALALLERVLLAAELVECRHLVLLSSALVYGAHADNPVPLTESQMARPVASLSLAMAKAGLEHRATRWAEETGSGLTVLRPTATLSEGDSSWVGAAIRAAAAIRSEGIDPPIQFLHHDDLASAVVLAATRRLDGIYNVAPDGWIGAELFRGLRGEAQVRLPEKASRWRHQVAKTLAGGSMLEGLEAYVTYPWVVANDKLRNAGWVPSYTNAEAYVAGTPEPLATSIRPQRRQELALGVVGAVGAAAVGALVWSARRVLR